MPFCRTFYLRSISVLKFLLPGILFYVFSVVLLTAETDLSGEKTPKGVLVHWRTGRTCRAEMAEENVLRTCDGEQCSIIIPLERGDRVEVTLSRGEWLKVYVRGEVGWVHSSYVNECEEK